MLYCCQSAAVLVARDDMPAWPPSPAWAATLFPFVSLTYSNIYYEFFGAFERRLNRALRARPVEEDREAAAPRQEGDAGQGGEGQQGGNDQQQDQSVWAAMWGLGQAVVGIFRDQDIVLEAEVVPAHRPHVQVDGDVDVEVQIEVGGEDEQFDEEEARHMVEQFQEMLDEVEAEAEQGDDRPAARLEEDAEPAPQEQEQQAAPPPAIQGQNENDDAAAPAGENARAVGGTLTDIMSNIVLSLLYPSICFGMGEALRLTLPRSWVTRPSYSSSSWGGRGGGGYGRGEATGLLQRRWGRSLVGGCVYVVLKDAFVLYAKYRQVQQKRKRKVRNVERRREASSN